nr:LysE family translocator [Corynebacterium aquatimens]
MGIWLVGIVSPGPDVLQITRQGAKSRAAGVACALGIMVGNTFWIAASLLGLSALIQAFPQILAVLQLVGGSYLLYMGIGAVRAGCAARGKSGLRVEAAGGSSSSKAFWVGVATNLSNPKAVLFFGAVFAQFIKPGMGWEWMVAILVTMVITGVAWFVGFALLIDVIAGFLDRWGYLVDIVAGVIFAVLAVWMIFEGATALLSGV